jgi:hypothetical protein
MAVHERAEKIEPGVTRLFRYPESATDEEVAGARDHLTEEECRFNDAKESRDLANRILRGRNLNGTSGGRAYRMGKLS